MLELSGKLVLKGKKAKITLDPDSGGIWIWPNEQGRGCKGICIYTGRKDASYIGFYDGVDQKESACDLSLAVTDDGEQLLQFREEDGSVKIVDVRTLRT